MDDERPPSLWRGMWVRFAIAGGRDRVPDRRRDRRRRDEQDQRHRRKSLSEAEPHPGGGRASSRRRNTKARPQTFLVLGSDRRAKAKNAYERGEPHSDTILLVRFDPNQGQTSVLSIPRDLMVNIRTPEGGYYPNEKINAAYTLGSKLKGVDGGSSLAAETIEREVFPGLKLNGIIDVNFKGFIEVVDTLGCAYVNVDHRYLGGGAIGEDFSSINLQPGYQKLCYENALSYVRFRHFDSDFVRVARQQDFLRDLREQVNPEISELDKVAKAVGHAIHSTFNDSNQRADRTREADRVLADQAAAPGPLPDEQRQRPVQRRLLRDLDARTGEDRRSRTSCTATKRSSCRPRRTRTPPPRTTTTTPPPPPRPRSASTRPPARAKRSPRRCTCRSRCSTRVCRRAPPPRKRCAPYALKQRAEANRSTPTSSSGAQNMQGGYYDFEGTDWLNPPLFKNARTQTDRRAHLQTRRRRQPHPRRSAGARARPLLGHEHPARGTLQRADARDREIRAAAQIARRSLRRPSSASLTSASARLFWARGTVRIDHDANSRSASIASR